MCVPQVLHPALGDVVVFSHLLTPSTIMCVPQVLHPALGDVVVFDTRLIHRAQVIHLPSISP